MILRALAGLFAGLTGLSLVIIGAWRSDMALIAVGAPITSSMLAFFVGEANGKKQA